MPLRCLECTLGGFFVAKKTLVPQFAIAYNSTIQPKGFMYFDTKASMTFNSSHDQWAPLPIAVNEWLAHKMSCGVKYTWVWGGERYWSSKATDIEREAFLLELVSAIDPQYTLVYAEYGDIRSNGYLCGLSVSIPFLNDNALLCLSLGSTGTLSLSAYVPMREASKHYPIEEVGALIRKIYEEVKKRTSATATTQVGKCYAVMSGSEGLAFRELPNTVRNSFEPDNYSPEVLKIYERAKADLAAPKPKGRIVLFDGPPGTGKTHLLKALLQMTECTFVFVQPDLLVQMASPSFLPALIDFTREQGRPVVLLVEDADEVVAHRETGNVSAVSAVLNLGDGILGDLLDLRLVLTTNATVKQIDKAIRRPGRLSGMVTVGALTAEHANRVFRRIMGMDPETPCDMDPETPCDVFRESATLAEVYQRALDQGWTPPLEAPTKKIGF